MYMTYQKNNKGNYTKVFDRSQYSSIPDSVDWRTSNAVTSVKYQVSMCKATANLFLNVKSYILLSKFNMNVYFYSVATGIYQSPHSKYNDIGILKSLE